MGESAQAAPEINWQEAVARLAQERTQAETCVRLLKSFGDEAAIKRGAISYGEAKADYDGVIAGLVVALARKERPASLPDLEARLQRGFEKRMALSRSVRPLLPDPIGEKGVFDQVVIGMAKSIADALVAIWQRVRDDDVLMRQTIQTQLEAASWLAFADVAQ